MYIKKKDILTKMSAILHDTIESEGIPLDFGDRMREVLTMVGIYNSIPFERFGHAVIDIPIDDDDNQIVGGN